MEISLLQVYAKQKQKIEYSKLDFFRFWITNISHRQANPKSEWLSKVSLKVAHNITEFKKFEE